MNYELVKKLKNAGFKLRIFIDYKDKNLDGKTINIPIWGNLFLIDGNAYIQPTLSELIEACGDGTIVERVNANTSHARVFGYGDKYVERGSTPEEAGANLWLAFNEKEEPA